MEIKDYEIFDKVIYATRKLNPEKVEICDINERYFEIRLMWDRLEE